MALLTRKSIFIGLIAMGVAGFYILDELNYPKVLIAKQDIPIGAQVTPSMFVYEKVLEKKDWMIEQGDALSSMYLTEPLRSGEYVNKRDLSKKELVPIQAGEGVVAVNATDQEDVVAWQLQKGDMVAIAAFNKETKTSKIDERLVGLNVVAIVNRDGKDISSTGTTDRVEAINLKVTPEQARLIDEYERMGELRLIKQGDKQ